MTNKNSIHGRKDFINGLDLYPSKSSMDGKILSMDKSVINVKMVDDFFIRGCHSWMKRTDKDDG